jgi:transposase
MSKKRPVYSVEFKHESASLVLDKNYTVPEACRAVGVSYTALTRWVAQLKKERGGTTPKGQAMTPDQQRIQKLEAQLKQKEWENDILKKATALLMSDSIKR